MSFKQFGILAKNMMRYQFSLSKLLMAVGVIALFFVMYRYSVRDQFEAQHWKSDFYQRRKMVDSLERYYLRIGMKRSEVKKLLGEGDHENTDVSEGYSITSRNTDNDPGIPHYSIEFDGMERVKSFGMDFTRWENL